MDLNHLLLWMVGASCGLSAFFLLTANRWKSGRFAVAVMVGLILAISFAFLPQHAGFIGGGLWLAFMVLPSLGNTAVNWLVSVDRFALARIVARGLAFLHPFDGNLIKPKFITALQLIHAGDSTRADAILESLRNSPNTIGRAAAVIRMRTTTDFREFIAWVDTSAHRSQLLTDAQVVDAYLQAMGETGQRERMFDVFRERVVSHQLATSSTMRHVMRMKVAAFSGQVDFVMQVLDGPLLQLPDELKDYWLATAYQSAGNIPEATGLLHTIRNSRNFRILVATDRRLQNPVQSTVDEPLSVKDLEVVSSIARSLHDETQYAVLSGNKPGNRRGTWAIIALLALVFSFEIPGGAEDTDNLILLGALVIPLSLVDNEWWRVITAGFLHFGYMHLLMNCFGLLLFGQRVEQAWGKILLFACYGISSIGSISLVLLLSEATESNPAILVGASGGVMGLIGALLGHLAIGMMKVRSRVVVQEFMMLFLIIGLQLVFDANTPIVSSTCHLMGLLIGFSFGIFVARFQAKRQ